MASAWPTRIVILYVENQQVAIVCGWLMQCADSQVVRYCGKEGTKWYAVGLSDNPHRREKECRNSGMHYCVNVLVNTGMCFLEYFTIPVHLQEV